MTYIYKVFEHLKQFLMGILQHTHTVATTDVFAEILDDIISVWK